MSMFLMRVAQISGGLCGASPLFLLFGLGADDLSRFFHNWFVFTLTTLIVTLGATIAMQLVDD